MPTALPKRRRRLWGLLEPLAAAAFAFALTLAALDPDHPLIARAAVAAGQAARAVPERVLYFPNCAAAQSMGFGPIRRGEPGYAPHLDRDNDGIACEPWPRRR